MSDGLPSTPILRDPHVDPAAYDDYQQSQTATDDDDNDDERMPHRVEPNMSQPATQSYPAPAPFPAKHRASPPPITTLPGSPSPSSADVTTRPSAASTPPARRSPPAGAPASAPAPQVAQHPYAYAGYIYPPPSVYPPPPDGAHPHPHAHVYDPAAHGHYPPPPPFGAYVPYPVVHGMPPPSASASPGPASTVQIVHTDDAATKLSDRVRRRCFNCCTTDTSTWRRSNLSPGKVLCNKCGLFERTHSRPRPEQFPHKRGPLSSSSLRTRSPPGAAPYPPPAPAQPQVVYPPPPPHATPPTSHPGTPKIPDGAPPIAKENGVAQVPPSIAAKEEKPETGAADE
ncbi:hypothetical protein MKEN_00959200 [Mycena kentingensis (nom. inval.)]|nr:hypothetical protein MKEN_00959200 [Mycena kentingensis (nom. inval.)]